ERTGPGLALVAPVRLARALAGEELGQRHGLVAFPAAAGRAEVGDAGGRREPRASQHDDAAGLAPRDGKRTRRAHSVARQAGDDAFDLAQERPHGIGAGEAREAHLAPVVFCHPTQTNSTHDPMIYSGGIAVAPNGEWGRLRGVGIRLVSAAVSPDERAPQCRPTPHLSIESNTLRASG